MAGRNKKVYSRKSVTYRLMTSQLSILESVSKAIGKSKTDIVEEAIAMYINRLHLEGVI